MTLIVNAFILPALILRDVSCLCIRYISTLICAPCESGVFHYDGGD